MDPYAVVGLLRGAGIDGDRVDWFLIFKKKDPEIKSSTVLGSSEYVIFSGSWPRFLIA